MVRLFVPRRSTGVPRPEHTPAAEKAQATKDHGPGSRLRRGGGERNAVEQDKGWQRRRAVAHGKERQQFAAAGRGKNQSALKPTVKTLAGVACSGGAQGLGSQTDLPPQARGSARETFLLRSRPIEGYVVLLGGSQTGNRLGDRLVLIIRIRADEVAAIGAGCQAIARTVRSEERR